MAGNQGGMPPQAYTPPGEFAGDFSHVLPAGPVPEGRIMGHAGGERSQNFSGFMHSSGAYQQQEGESL
jgi:hypothetical protein